MLPRQRAHPVQERGLGHHDANRVRNGLQDHRRNLVAVLAERPLQRLNVVELQHDQVGLNLWEDPRRQWVQLAHTLRGRDHVGEQVVMPAV